MEVVNIVLQVQGMGCQGCVDSVEEALNAVDGVTEAKVDLAAQTATIKGTAKAESLIAAVVDAGYEASL